MSDFEILYPRCYSIGKVQIAAWVAGVPVEAAVWSQVQNLASVPGVERIAIMPDAHVGNGACVGSAILTRDIVIPAAVGVDIGCGMIAAPLKLTVGEIKEYLPQIRAAIEKRVPVGRTANGGEGDRGAWHDIPEDIKAASSGLAQLDDGYNDMIGHYQELTFPRVWNQLGTLGTGNHFIEIQYEVDEEQSKSLDNATVWVMLHSGSRGVGNRIGTTFTKLARKEMERWHIELPDPELAFLPISSELGHDYLAYTKWAQKYAWQSRLIMFRRSLEGIAAALGFTNRSVIDYDEDKLVHVHHNYISGEKHFGKPGFVIRKGAINADRGTTGIIPSNMGSVSFITSGRGNPLSLNTSSHGAGRVLSRTAARKSITMEEHLAALGDVECRRDDDVIDESPGAYKDIDAVMNAQRDLTEPIVKLKQLVVVKG